MSCEIPAPVLEYLELVERGPHRVCREQTALAAYIRRVFETEDLTVDATQLDHYLGISKYFSFRELFPWQKFVTALWDCTYNPNGTPRWKTLLCMVARGAGKDGYIAYDALCSVSPYNPVGHYNVDICANNEY